MAAFYYRYVDEIEKSFVEKNHRIQSNTGVTWFTPDLYNSGAEAKEMLVLAKEPTWRIGPIQGDDMPDFDHCTLQTVGPMDDEDGGGWECATTKPVFLFTISRLAPKEN